MLPSTVVIETIGQGVGSIVYQWQQRRMNNTRNRLAFRHRGINRHLRRKFVTISDAKVRRIPKSYKYNPRMIKRSKGGWSNESRGDITVNDLHTRPGLENKATLARPRRLPLYRRKRRKRTNDEIQRRLSALARFGPWPARHDRQTLTLL